MLVAVPRRRVGVNVALTGMCFGPLRVRDVEIVLLAELSFLQIPLDARLLVAVFERRDALRCRLLLEKLVDYQHAERLPRCLVRAARGCAVVEEIRHAINPAVVVPVGAVLLPRELSNLAVDDDWKGAVLSQVPLGTALESRLTYELKFTAHCPPRRRWAPARL